MIILEYLIGVDIGGTKVRVGYMPLDRLSRDALRLIKFSTPKDAPGAISREVISNMKKLLSEDGVDINSIKAISIATAGPIDLEKGEVFNNANLGFKNIPLKEPILQEFPGLPVFIVNDCNGAVLGIHKFEARADERENLAYITISTGIGGGVICNGHLILGKEGNAAEVGHGVVNAVDGRQCNCGARGCWEAYSSGTAVEKIVKERIKGHPDDFQILMEIAGNDINNISSKDVYAAARKGDAGSIKIVKNANYYSAIGIGLMNNYYDLETVYLGGSMLKDDDLIIPRLENYFNERTIEFTINKPPKIKKTALGDDVGILGAIALGYYKLMSHAVLS
ncbi:MAG: ROK family protein [Promethearchaeota archaeon]